MRCSCCGRSLRVGEKYFNPDGDAICQDCINDWMDENITHVEKWYILDNHVYSADEMEEILRDDCLVTNEEEPEPKEWYGEEDEPGWKEK